MSHANNIIKHCASRIRTRLNREAIPHDIMRMKRAILSDNGECFLKRDCGDTIEAVVPYQNIHTVAVYNKAHGLIVTVGSSLSKKE